MTTDAKQLAAHPADSARAPAASPNLPPLGAPRVPAQPDFARLGLDDPEGRN